MNCKHLYTKQNEVYSVEKLRVNKFQAYFVHVHHVMTCMELYGEVLSAHHQTCLRQNNGKIIYISIAYIYRYMRRSSNEIVDATQ